jgi:hypothetical protein
MVARHVAVRRRGPGDGGVGPGNSAFQCGLDEADPGGTIGTFSAPVHLAPRTLYFLAVGCNGSVSLKGAANGAGALSEPLVGVLNYTAHATRIITPWTFASGALPTLFGSGTITGSSIPNVYAGP